MSCRYTLYSKCKHEPRLSCGERAARRDSAGAVEAREKARELDQSDDSAAVRVRSRGERLHVDAMSEMEA